jgi:hypothetical protein
MTAGQSYRYNFDGIVSYSVRGAHEYTQIFHNGAIENAKFDSQTTWQVYTYLDISGKRNSGSQNFLNIEEYYLRAHPPFYVMLSMIGVKEHVISVEPHNIPKGEIREGNPIDRDILVLPEIMIDSFSTDVAKTMKGIFDGVWNAAGWPESKYLHEYCSKILLLAAVAIILFCCSDQPVNMFS